MRPGWAQRERFCIMWDRGVGGPRETAGQWRGGLSWGRRVMGPVSCESCGHVVAGCRTPDHSKNHVVDSKIMWSRLSHVVAGYREIA